MLMKKKKTVLMKTKKKMMLMKAKKTDKAPQNERASEREICSLKPSTSFVLSSVGPASWWRDPRSRMWEVVPATTQQLPDERIQKKTADNSLSHFSLLFRRRCFAGVFFSAAMEGRIGQHSSR
jgi:hypothetical protein